MSEVEQRKSTPSLAELQAEQLAQIRYIAESVYAMRQELEKTKNKVANISGILTFFAIIFLLIQAVTLLNWFFTF